MKKLNSFLQNKRAFFPSAIIIGILIVSGAVSYAFSPNNSLVAKQSETERKTVALSVRPTQEILPTQQTATEQKTTVVVTKTTTVSPVPTVTNVVSQTSPAVANIPAPQQTTAALTPTQIPASKTIAVEVTAPDGSSSFTVDYTDGMNACDVLQKAKDNGKLKSVTFDDSYMSTLHSRYVSEINGFSNNWTFSINGASPLGCSLSQPKPNDKIVWKFG